VRAAGRRRARRREEHIVVPSRGRRASGESSARRICRTRGRGQPVRRVGARRLHPGSDPQTAQRSRPPTSSTRGRSTRIRRRSSRPCRSQRLERASVCDIALSSAAILRARSVRRRLVASTRVVVTRPRSAGRSSRRSSTTATGTPPPVTTRSTSAPPPTASRRPSLDPGRRLRVAGLRPPATGGERDDRPHDERRDCRRRRHLQAVSLAEELRDRAGKQVLRRSVG
jgi:hypothetical protein